MKKSEIINSLISALGAIICISFIAYLDKYFDGAIWLIPPFGATMVLVMAVHSSPLAQPKNIILGHVLSALSGVVILLTIGDSFLALGIAVGLAVFVMMMTKTMNNVNKIEIAHVILSFLRNIPSSRNFTKTPRRFLPTIF